MSNRFKFHILGALLAASAATAPAQAAAVSATASFLDLQLSLLSASNNSYLNDAATPFDSILSAGSALENVEFNSSLPEATSYAAIFDSFAPLPQTTAAAIHDGFGHASVLWTFDWVATATGTASISLDFLTTAVVQNLLPGESTLARSYGSVLLDGSALGNEALHFFQNATGTYSAIEQLGFTFGVTEGQHGTFTMALTSDAFAAPAAVPVPAALPLLLSALAGCGLFARRRADRAV